MDKLDLITVYVFNEHPPAVYEIVSSLCLCLCLCLCLEGRSLPMQYIIKRDVY